MTQDSEKEILQRIQSALESARSVLSRFTAGAIEAEYKAGQDPVTEADKSVDAVLHKELLRTGEGWLSEETVDDFSRLSHERVWVVDPLDGTREFVAGIPEFCVSVALVDNGRAVAGGICNPVTNEIFLGSLNSGVTYNEKPARCAQRKSLRDARACEPERGQPWRMAAVCRRPVRNSSDGVRCLQTGSGLCRFGRRHFHAGTQARMGYRRRRGFSRKRRWICLHARKHAIAVQSKAALGIWPDCRGSLSAGTAAVAA